MARTSIRTRLGAAAAAALAAGTAVLAAAPAQAAASGWADCPVGSVCIYAGTSERSPIIWERSRAGTYNLSNMYDDHLIYNNQTDGWKFWTCEGYNGTRCSTGYLPAGHYMIKNLTPVNSVRITP
ncbi:hypothetical protein HYE82_34020 [Streptomyces sp. BR123]|jgi:hypothetical protein|uniref:hypothetical protein n=1 Tax=Streptomyces sp. BR123 TaxID=2749828 RepID=UPI0015C4BAF2|nr:hypothetical protein [Streptomyces sp. BR123]NXY99308.1 hypothetical protein [Streptomyces sp. BR123]